MCLLCGWRESDHDVLIIYGVLHANFVYTLGPASKSGAGRCLLSLNQSLEESVFYGYLCLFCSLAMVAIVSLVKAKHTEKASFDTGDCTSTCICLVLRQPCPRRRELPLVQKETRVLI